MFREAAFAAAIRSLLFAGLLLSAGCGGSGGAVAAKLTLDGAPLADAEATLHPDGDGAKGNYVAKSKSDGSLDLRGPGGDGVAPGKYKVTVKRVELKKGAKVPDALKNDPGQLQAMGLMANSLPAQYGDPARTPLKIEVKPGTNPAVTLDVTSR